MYQIDAKASTTNNPISHDEEMWVYLICNLEEERKLRLGFFLSNFDVTKPNSSRKMNNKKTLETPKSSATSFEHNWFVAVGFYCSAFISQFLFIGIQYISYGFMLLYDRQLNVFVICMTSNAMRVHRTEALSLAHQNQNN